MIEFQVDVHSRCHSHFMKRRAFVREPNASFCAGCDPRWLLQLGVLNHPDWLNCVASKLPSFQKPSNLFGDHQGTDIVPVSNFCTSLIVLVDGPLNDEFVSPNSVLEWTPALPAPPILATPWLPGRSVSQWSGELTRRGYDRGIDRRSHQWTGGTSTSMR